MKATGIVRHVDDLGRIVIPKEIRRTLYIKEGTPLPKTLTVEDGYLWAMKMLHERTGVYCVSYFSALISLLNITKI